MAIVWKRQCLADVQEENPTDTSGLFCHSYYFGNNIRRNDGMLMKRR